MLTGLLRIRVASGGASGLARILWKQVRCRFSLVVILLFTSVNFRS